MATLLKLSPIPPHFSVFEFLGNTPLPLGSLQKFSPRRPRLRGIHRNKLWDSHVFAPLEHGMHMYSHTGTQIHRQAPRFTNTPTRAHTHTHTHTRTRACTHTQWRHRNSIAGLFWAFGLITLTPDPLHGALFSEPPCSPPSSPCSGSFWFGFSLWPPTLSSWIHTFDLWDSHVCTHIVGGKQRIHKPKRWDAH